MNPIQGIVEYIKSSKAELEKVSWPSRQDTLRYGALVIAVSIIVAGFFGFLDFSLGKGVDALVLRKGTATQAPTAPAPKQEDVQVTPSDIQAVDQSGKPVQVDVKPVK